MENKIRLVWDFRGMDALKTAEHQLVHLLEFMKKEDISFFDDKVEEINEMYSICSISIMQSNLDFVKNKLKPHRGFLAK
jgi:hypothetical protein